MAAVLPRREPGFDFDQAIDRAQTAPVPRLVVANKKTWGFTESAFMLAHDPVAERKASVASMEARPKTSHGILNRPKRQSFSRPLTSDGNKRGEAVPPPPSLPPDFTTRFQSIAPASTIGVAIGSPSSPGPELLSLNTSVSAPPMTPFIPATPTTSLKTASPAPEPPKPQPQQSKAKRWLGMGSLFRKKSPAPSLERPKTATNATNTPAERPKTAKESTSSVSTTEVIEPPTTRRRSMSRRLSFGSGLRSKYKTSELPPLPPMADLERVKSKDSSSRQGSGSSKASENFMAPIPQVDRPTTSSKPTLDVDIDQTKLARFSVMFSDVLFNQQTAAESHVAATHGPPKLNRAMSSPRERAANDLFNESKILNTNDRAPAVTAAATLQQRRKPQFEKLSPLNMHRISQSPTFHQAPFAPRSAPSTYSAGSEPTFNPIPSPTIQRRPVPSSSAGSPVLQNRSQASSASDVSPPTPSTNKPLAYSLFPKTDVSPSLPAITTFSDERSMADDVLARASVSDYGDHSEEVRPLRSSSLFPSESIIDGDASTHHSRVLYPPSPPLSSAESPSADTMQSMASPKYETARSSFGPYDETLAHSPVASNGPNGIEINVEDSNTGEQTKIGAFGYPGLLSPPSTVSEKIADDSDASVRHSTRSSAIGDSPVLGATRSVNLGYHHDRARFLKGSESSNGDSIDLSPRQDGYNQTRARTPTFVHIDDLDNYFSDDEEAFARRQSCFGIMEDAHGPL